MAIKEILKEAESNMKQSQDAYHRELAHLRTGQATPTLLEGIKVNYYGTLTAINHLAAVHVPEARLIVIQPFDKSSIEEIIKALMSSDLGITPNSDGNIIRLQVPPLTEERRKELVKHLYKITEDFRVSIRNYRRDANDLVKKSKKDGDISEDDEHKTLEKIQEITDQYIDDIDKAMKKKEEEILQV